VVLAPTLSTGGVPTAGKGSLKAATSP
jgi:hypothetical protein